MIQRRKILGLLFGMLVGAAAFAHGNGNSQGGNPFGGYSYSYVEPEASMSVSGQHYYQYDDSPGRPDYTITFSSSSMVYCRASFSCDNGNSGSIGVQINTTVQVGSRCVGSYRLECMDRYFRNHYANLSVERLQSPGGSSTAGARAVEKIVQLGGSSSGNQSQSLVNISLINSLAANQTATNAAVFCAKAANVELEKKSGAQDLAQCSKAFEAADELAKNTKKELEVDKDTAEEGAKTLNAFEKNFGIDKDAYLERMVKSRGQREEFTEMLLPKLPQKRIDAAFAAAEKIVESAVEPEKVTGDEWGEAAPAQKKSSVRSALQRKIAAREPALLSPKSDSGKRSAAKPQSFTGENSLTPLENEFSDLEDGGEEGLSLFDVVHQKYREMKRDKRI